MATTTAVTSATPAGPRPGEPYLVVSTDGHAGPILERDLRPYCPKAYLNEYDADTRRVREAQRAAAEGAKETGLHGSHATIAAMKPERRRPESPASTLPEIVKEAFELTKYAGGQQDPHARLRDM